MRKLTALLLAVLLLCGAALAESPEEKSLHAAREALEKLGYTISEEAVDVALTRHREMQAMYLRAGVTEGLEAEQSDFVYNLLAYEGMGVYDYDTLTWTPTSNQIYVFDAEFFNIEGMYTEFLQGVQAIMPDAQIANVREDLSGMDEYLEGSRKVFFEFNGHSYVKTLKSYGDWLNTEIIDFLNQVLTTEGMGKRLHIVSDAWDQMVFLIYGTDTDARALRSLMSVEETEPANGGESVLDWLSGLFGW